MTRAGYKAALVISLALSLFLAGSGGEIVPQRPDRVDFGDLVPFPDFDRDPRYSPMMAQYEAILRGGWYDLSFIGRHANFPAVPAP